jgi:hypothetical protein
MAEHLFAIENEPVAKIEVYGGDARPILRQCGGTNLVIAVEPGVSHTVSYTMETGRVVVVLPGTSGKYAGGPREVTGTSIENFFGDPLQELDVVSNGILNTTSLDSTTPPVVVVYVPVGSEEPAIIHQ